MVNPKWHNMNRRSDIWYYALIGIIFLCMALLTIVCWEPENPPNRIDREVMKLQERILPAANAAESQLTTIDDDGIFTPASTNPAESITFFDGVLVIYKDGRFVYQGEEIKGSSNLYEKMIAVLESRCD